LRAQFDAVDLCLGNEAVEVVGDGLPFAPRLQPVFDVVADVGTARSVSVPTLTYSDIAVFIAVSSCVIVMWLIELLLRARGCTARPGPLSVVGGMAIRGHQSPPVTAPVPHHRADSPCLLAAAMRLAIRLPTRLGAPVVETSAGAR